MKYVNFRHIDKLACDTQKIMYDNIFRHTLISFGLTRIASISIVDLLLRSCCAMDVKGALRCNRIIGQFMLVFCKYL